MTCARAMADAPAFVAGTMAPSDLEGFEIHLLSCSDCREAVRIGGVVRSHLGPATNSSPGGAGARISVTRPTPAIRIRRRGVVAVVLLAAASLTIVILSGDERRADQLSAVVAPAFSPMSVRRAADESATEALIERGMDAYLRGDYARAAARLAEAAREDSTSGVAFFLGASHLLAGDPHSAIRSLRIAWADVGGPFEADARLLAAKAWLRLDHADSALAVLDPRTVGAGVPRAALVAFADSIRGIR